MNHEKETQHQINNCFYVTFISITLGVVLTILMITNNITAKNCMMARWSRQPHWNALMVKLKLSQIELMKLMEYADWEHTQIPKLYNNSTIK